MNPAKLTVLMPAYNAERYIAEAISSVLAQTFADFTLLIIDDGSTDRTKSVIRSFQDPRIEVIHQTNQGIAGALNAGLMATRTDLVVRFDADDVCYPDRLDKQYRFMTDHPDYFLAGTLVDYADMEGEYLFSHVPPGKADAQIRKLSYRVCPFIHSSVIYRKQEVLSIGGYNIHAHGFEDHLLWRRLISKGKVCNMADILMKVRFNPDSLTMDETCRNPVYLNIKYEALRTGDIGAKEGQLLLEVMKAQEASGEKAGAYHVLLAKKYLWNNTQPRKAREHALQVLEARHFMRKGIYLLLLSYLPGPMLVWLYRAVNPLTYVRK